MNTLTAWLSIGSTYTFLTALRIKSKIKEENVKIEIYPISIRYIMKNQNNIPFPPEKEEKTRYMWRDIQRRAKKHGLPVPKTPVPYPLKEFDQCQQYEKDNILEDMILRKKILSLHLHFSDQEIC